MPAQQTPDVGRETTHQIMKQLESQSRKQRPEVHTRDFGLSVISTHQNASLILFAPAALVCVASSSERTADTALECFESAVVVRLVL